MTAASSLPASPAPRRRAQLQWAALGLLVGIWLAAAPAAAQQQATDVRAATIQLFQAVMADDLPAVQAALAAGADPSARDRWGMSPVDMAVDKGYFRVAHFLLSVRNFQQDQADAAPPEIADFTTAAGATPRNPAAVGQVDSPSGPSMPAQPVTGVAAAPIEPPEPSAPDVPSWPADKPNPFDPTGMAPGATLPIIGAPRASDQVPQVPSAPDAPPPGPSTRSAPERSDGFDVTPEGDAGSASSSGVPDEQGTQPVMTAAAIDPAPDADEPGFIDRVASWFSGDEDVSAEATGENGVATLQEQATVEAYEGDGLPTRSAASSEAPSDTAELAAMPTAAGGGTDQASSSTPTLGKNATPESDAPDTDAAESGVTSAPPSGAGWTETTAAEAAADTSVVPTVGEQVALARSTGPDNVATAKKRDPIKNVILSLGKTVALGQPVAAHAQPSQCLQKRRKTEVYCVVDVDWPVAVMPLFRVGTVLYQGTGAVARFADGRAVRYHALFPSASFDAVVAHFERQYGPPTDALQRRVASLGTGRQPNPSAMWQSVIKGRTSILDVRKFDDASGAFPDMRRGVVQLYWSDAPTIFPQVSSIELMILQGRPPR